ncbi:MAG: ribose-5-phosphate isomerase, partial [Nitrosopumilaceae archaeon]
MSFDDAISALSTDALKFVKDGYVIGLGSGRAATAFVKSLAILLREKNIKVRVVPTSLQIKII